MTINKQVHEALDCTDLLDEALALLPEEFSEQVANNAHFKHALAAIFAFGIAHGADLTLSVIPDLAKKQGIHPTVKGMFTAGCLEHIINRLKHDTMPKESKVVMKNCDIEITGEDILAGNIGGLPKKLVEGIAKHIIEAVIAEKQMPRHIAASFAIRMIDDGVIIVASQGTAKAMGGRQALVDALENDGPESVKSSEKDQATVNAVVELLHVWAREGDNSTAMH